MTKTGTQNRPYYATKLMVRCTIIKGADSESFVFDWNDRGAVRDFAAHADKAIRSGFIVRTCMEG
jgi:hypothetical protein